MTKLTKLMLLIVFCICTTVTAAPPDGQPRLGINLAGPADWATELPFVDVFRTSRPWISQRKGAGWGQGPELAIDRFGWVKELQPGCYAESMLCTISDGHYPSGIYTVIYEGDGEIEFGKGPRIVEAVPGRIRIEVDSSEGGFSLQIKKTNPQNYVRNIHVIMPGFEDTWQQNPFHPAFLKRWQGMACFRFMDWMHTNGSHVATWADRPTLDHATFSKRGVALEWMVELCNRTQVDPWFCMPHQADDDFIRRFATMVKEHLDPSLRIYIEYSNEVWNGQFPQSRYASQQGLRLGLGHQDKPWEAGWHFTALRSMQIFQIWEDVFGGHDRFIRVLPTQSGNTGVSEGILSFRDAAKHADALAGAPYMPFSIGRGKMKDLGEQMRDWNVDQLLDYFEETAFQNSLGRMDKDKAVSDKYGLKLIAYEGGQHMVAFVKDRDLVARLTETMQQANRHPRMGDLYRRYFDHWADIGGGTFAVFSSISRWSNHGAWGLAEFYDSQPSEYPKLDAVLQWARRHDQPVDLSGR
jgi:hypothetical protein